MTRPLPGCPPRRPRMLARLLTSVLDGRSAPEGGSPRLVPVAELLDLLTAAELAALRRATREATLAGRPLFLCPGCEQPVYLAVRSVGASGTTGGARGFFKHHARRSGEPDCPLAAERGTSVAAVDARRFDGAHEGAWHIATKAALRDLLVAELGPEAVRVEARLAAGADWRRPDLLVRDEQGEVALEVQGASPQLDVVLQREAFYGRAGVGLMWVVDATDLGRLARQGFQDAAFHAGAEGLLFGWSARAAAASREAGGLRLHRLQVTEREGDLVVTDGLVPFAEAVAEVRGRLAQGPWPLAEDALARAFRAALLAEDDGGALRAAFERLRVEIGLAAGWEQACEDRLMAAVGATVTALTGRKGIASRFPESTPPAAILNNFLGTRAYRPWVPLVLRVCEGHARADAHLERASTVRLIREAWAEVEAAPERAAVLRRRWGALFDRLFPPPMRAGRRAA